MRVAIALRHHESRYRWLIAIGGLVSVVIVILLWVILPWSSIVLVDALIGFELMVMVVT